MRYIIRTVYMIGGIAGYLGAALFSHYPVETTVGVFFVTAVVTGIVNLKDERSSA